MGSEVAHPVGNQVRGVLEHEMVVRWKARAACKEESASAVGAAVAAVEKARMVVVPTAGIETFLEEEQEAYGHTNQAEKPEKE